MYRPAKLYDIVRRQVESHPERVALKYADSSWTWQELDDRVRRLAAALQEDGVRASDRIATIDRNAAASLEVTLAASLLGAVHAIMSFRLAPKELAYLLSDAGVRILFTSDDYLTLLDGVEAQCQTLRKTILVGGSEDDYEALVASAEPLTDSELREGGGNDAVIQLYTSGTTGHPKGALLTHDGLGSHAAVMGPAYEMDESTVNGVPMPLFHVGGTCWALGSMNSGGVTVVLRDPTPHALLEAVPRHGITHIFLVPAVIAGILATPGAAQSFATVRVIAYGGSLMPEPLIRTACETFTSRLFSVYGMTEMSGLFCVLRDEEHRDQSRPELLRSVGKPLPGNELRIVEPNTFEPLPHGEVGEIWVRSPQHFAGYWRLPEATSETLVEGWLRTGDAGRLTEDGYLFLEDRIKDMLISGGENVYPAEIERVLIEHESVAEVAVVGAHHEKWGETPVAFVVPAPEANVDGEALIAFARESLARYKTPSRVVVVDALPRNTMGKILKRDLRQRVQTVSSP